ncbi:MAG: FAD-dependent oxidoreductase, partial [Actinomycetota bacterium]|nr:FAD-dependent oxidoreductase [Actinomycetota bacterium]
GRAQWHAYFAAAEPPNDSKAIHLLPSADGPCRNIAIMSNVAPEYAPQGSALIVAAGPTIRSDAPLAEAQQQLARVFGSQCESWELVKHGIVEHAQPVFVPGSAFRRDARRTEEVVVAGDHRTTPSIQGAMVSGRIAAETAISGG